MLAEPPGSGQFAWRCIECQAGGYGGASAFTVHYIANHSEPKPTYTNYLIEARTEHGLKGTAAYEWAHKAYDEYLRNQQ